MSNQNRVQAGVPTGGQFATAPRSEAAVNLDNQVASADLERDTVRSLLSISARTGLPTTSVEHIGSLIAKSTPETRAGNASSLAAANAITVRDIDEIDRVVNRGELSLAVAARVDEDEADQYAAAGLAGSLAPYRGNNPDVPSGALTYLSPTGRELALYTSDEGEFFVRYDDRHDESNSFTTSPGEIYDTPFTDRVDTVKDTLWSVAVADTAWDLGLAGDEAYEVRDVQLERGNSSPVASITVQAQETGDFETIHHDYSTGTTTIEADGRRLDGWVAENELAAVFEDMRSEPDDGDWQKHTRTVFAGLLTSAAAAEDAPAWARDAAAKAGA